MFRHLLVPTDGSDLSRRTATHAITFAATPCATVHDGIIAAAAHHGCDLIFMASHGRRGIGALLLGSETQKVLTHSKIPVLVHRADPVSG